MPTQPTFYAPKSCDVEETQEETIALALSEGRMYPAEVSVNEGELVSDKITSDKTTIRRIVPSTFSAQPGQL